MLFTFGTLSATGPAYEFFTAMTETPAVQAACQIADAAATRTLLAEIAIAVFTGITILQSDSPIAVVTGRTLPFIEPDIGTVSIVGVQDMRDQGEEVTQSRLFQGPAYGYLAVPFAQAICRYMGMGNRLI